MLSTFFFLSLTPAADRSSGLSAQKIRIRGRHGYLRQEDAAPIDRTNGPLRTPQNLSGERRLSATAPIHQPFAKLRIDNPLAQPVVPQ